MKNKLLLYLGNLLIALSIASTIYIFYPLLAVYLFPPNISKNLPADKTFITIPKIHAQAEIKDNVDPFNETEYRAVLKKYVAQAKNTSIPGDKGTSFLFAHSSGPFWEQTRMNTVFLRLNDLKSGDIIEISRKGKVLRYKVYDKKIVDPTEISYLKPSSENKLIIQTCYPIGTDWQRLLVFAHP